MLSLWSEQSCLTRQEIKDYIESIQRQDVTTEGRQSTTTVVTAMEVFGPILDVGEPGIIEQNIGEQDSATETMQDVTTEEGQSTTNVVTAMKVLGPILDVGEHGIIEQNVGEQDSATEFSHQATELTSDRTTTNVSFLYGEEEEEKRLNAVVRGGEVRTTNAVTMEPTTANGTATRTAATIDPAVTTAKTAWMLGSAIGEIEIPARSKRSMD